MIGKEKGAEDKCPSCKGTLVCREVEYKGESKLQWQYKDKEVAHFSYDFKTGKTACKESSDVPKTSNSSVATDKLNLDKISIPGDQIASITSATVEGVERMLIVLAATQKVCGNVGITHPATIGMIFNQVCENRRDTV